MIPQAYITEWSNQVPWRTNEQVEQDLVISRALVEIFSDPFLSERLAFRGGTALHKLYLQPQPRYSEDIDLVQIREEPFGPVIDRLRERLSFLGDPVRKQKEHNTTLVFRFESEFVCFLTNETRALISVANDVIYAQQRFAVIENEIKTQHGTFPQHLSVFFNEKLFPLE